MSVISKGFDDPTFQAKVRDELPKLFQEARKEALEYNKYSLLVIFENKN